MAMQDQSEHGRSRRDAVSWVSHGEWSPVADRRDPIDVLLASNESRLEEGCRSLSFRLDGGESIHVHAWVCCGDGCRSGGGTDFGLQCRRATTVT